MKHLTFILLFCLGFIATASAQLEEDNKSEYRYWGIVVGINHGFGAPENTNENVMLHTAKGDMYKKNFEDVIRIQKNYNFAVQIKLKKGIINFKQKRRPAIEKTSTF